jgi:hypothetical protein
LKFIYKIENETETPEYLKKHLLKRKEMLQYNLRRKSAYNIPNYTMAISQNSLSYNGIKLFNEFKQIYGLLNNSKIFCKALMQFVKTKV